MPINISMKDKAGVTLLTSGKFCEDNIVVNLDAASTANLTPKNIKKGVSILGIEGAAMETSLTVAEETLFIRNRVSTNLLTFKDVDYTAINGITYRVKNGIIYIEGTDTAGTTIDLEISPIDLYFNSDYGFSHSSEVPSGVAYYLLDSSNGPVTWTTGMAGMQLGIEEGAPIADTSVIKFRIAIDTGTVFSNFKIKPYLVDLSISELGEWEPGDGVTDGTLVL